MTCCNKKSQIFAGFIVNLGGFALGSVLSWTSPALPSLRIDTESFPNGISLTDESWIGSIVPLGAALGGPIAGALSDSFGRRNTMMLITIPFMLGWIGIYLANNVSMIICSRFITGICAGAFSLVSPMFVAEVSDVSIRGYLGAGFELFVCIGILFIFIIGTYLPWRAQALASCCVPAIILFFLSFIPESPRFLLAKGRIDDAFASLAWFRGVSISKSKMVEDELIKLQIDLNNSNSSRRSSRSSSSFLSSYKQLIESPTWKPVSIALLLVLINELSGIDVITFYTVDLFKSAGVSIDSYTSTIILGVVQILGAICAALLVDRFGRRFLLLFSETFVVASLCCFTWFFIMKKYQPTFTMEYLQYLPLASLIIYVFSYVIGLGTIIYMIMSEILPHHVKGLAAGFITISKWIFGFIITKSFDGCILAIGDIGVFSILTTGCCAGLLYTYYFVPETSEKTLEEIQALFGNHVDHDDQNYTNIMVEEHSILTDRSISDESNSLIVESINEKKSNNNNGIHHQINNYGSTEFIP